MITALEKFADVSVEPLAGLHSMDAIKQAINNAKLYKKLDSAEQRAHWQRAAQMIHDNFVAENNGFHSSTMRLAPDELAKLRNMPQTGVLRMQPIYNSIVDKYTDLCGELPSINCDDGSVHTAPFLTTIKRWNDDLRKYENATIGVDILDRDARKPYKLTLNWDNVPKTDAPDLLKQTALYNKQWAGKQNPAFASDDIPWFQSQINERPTLLEQMQDYNKQWEGKSNPEYAAPVAPPAGSGGGIAEWTKRHAKHLAIGAVGLGASALALSYYAKKRRERQERERQQAAINATTPARM